MIREKRAKEIERKAGHQRRMLAGVSSTAPVNVQVRLRAYCFLWEMKQKYYKNDIPLPYVSKRSYKEDMAEVAAIEKRIIQDGSDEDRARQAIAEAREYLDIVAKSRIRDNTKNRVF